MRNFDRINYVQMNCCICNKEDNRIDNYMLSFKLAGVEKHSPAHFCAICWSKGRFQSIADMLHGLIHGE